MLRKIEFEAKANKIYESNRKDWEIIYFGKVIAIDSDTEKLVAMGGLAVRSR